MKRPPRLALCTVLAWTLLTPRPAVPADAPPRLKTQVVKLKLRPDARPERPPAIELVQLPPGKITLKGADGKDHDHEIKPIWIAQYETRWDEYDVFYRALDMPDRERLQLRGDGKQYPRPRPPYDVPYGGYDAANDRYWESPGHDGFPANCIHFQAALKYCAWLSRHTGKRFRLPTEAEWEYACRAGGPPLNPNPRALDRVAWFADNAKDKTHAVGKKQPNAWGLYDMLGNVGEYAIRDPNDDKGLLAGGSYKDPAKDVHSAAREPYSPDWQKNDPEEPKETSWLNWSVHHVGFRVVMED